MKRLVGLLIGLTILVILLSGCSTNQSPLPNISSITPSSFRATSSVSGNSTTPPSGLQQTSASTPGISFALIIEPGDAIVPVLNMIQQASKSIDLVMYEMEDSNIENALVSAENHGVTVRVLLNHGYYNQPSKDNDEAYQYLRSKGVSVHWMPAYFALTHQKTLVVDDKQAVIMTFNFTPQYYSADRDFGVVDKDPKDIAVIESTFNDDWQGSRDKPSTLDDLVWSPGADVAILSIINNSHKSLYIENEEMADAAVTNALIAASRRGVTVQVVMTYSSEWATDFKKLSSGRVKVRTYAASAPLYIHAKMILADGTTAFIGSQNFSVTSLKDNRELGIILTDSNILGSLAQTFQGDWAGGIQTP